MKTPIAFLGSLLVVAISAGAETDSPPLVEVNSADYGDTEYLMNIVEFERNAKTSKFKLTYKKQGSSVGSSMFVAHGFYKVAKARGTEYFTNLKEWTDKDGSRIYIGGFTDNNDAEIQSEFGAEFSPTNEEGQPREFMSVSQGDLLWGKKK